MPVTDATITRGVIATLNAIHDELDPDCDQVIGALAVLAPAVALLMAQIAHRDRQEILTSWIALMRNEVRTHETDNRTLH